MSLREKPLNTPLYRRNHDGVFFAVAAVALGILHVKPDTTEGWIAAVSIMAPTLWLVLVGPKFLDNWQSRSRYAWVSWFVLALKLTIFLVVIKYIYPYCEAALGEFLQA